MVNQYSYWYLSVIGWATFNYISKDNQPKGRQGRGFVQSALPCPRSDSIFDRIDQTFDLIANPLSLPKGGTSRL